MANPSTFRPSSGMDIFPGQDFAQLVAQNYSVASLQKIHEKLNPESDDIIVSVIAHYGKTVMEAQLMHCLASNIAMGEENRLQHLISDLGIPTKDLPPDWKKRVLECLDDPIWIEKRMKIVNERKENKTFTKFQPAQLEKPELAVLTRPASHMAYITMRTIGLGLAEVMTAIGRKLQPFFPSAE